MLLWCTLVLALAFGCEGYQNIPQPSSGLDARIKNARSTYLSFNILFG